jgi:hypothetical protein
LKLQYDEPLSNFADNFRLRRYNPLSDRVQAETCIALGRALQVEPMKPMLKAPGTKRSKLKHDEPPAKFAFNSNLRRYSWVP